ncbi:MAG: hypothetical protein ACI32N_07845 [Bulleidia sp.]
MSTYTAGKGIQRQNICITDEDYINRLVATMKSFRTFDCALDSFISEHGYTGDINDVKEKTSFIMERFENSGVPMEKRTLLAWYEKHVPAEKREIAFRFCFAFHLNLSETQDFFRRVYLQRGIDCHDIHEAVYYWCIGHQLSWKEAQAVLEQVPVVRTQGNVDMNGDVLYTETIIHELNRFDTVEALVTFLNENREQFGYNNATARKYISELWKRIAGENGIAWKEADLLYDACDVSEHRSVWDIFLQIFGLKDYDHDHTRLFVIGQDRTLQPVLKENPMMHPIAANAFPNRQGLENIMNGKYESNEVVRKTMILLGFYRFWAECSIHHRTVDYMALEHDGYRCLTSINRMLGDTGYPSLYEGNPYDWIFIYCCCSAYPLSDSVSL